MYPYTLTRAVLEEQYRPITWGQHVRAMASAVRRETWGPEDIVVEDAGGGLVTVWPPGVMPYVWRTVWRTKRSAPMRRKGGRHG